MREGRCTGGSGLDHRKWIYMKTEGAEYLKKEMKRKPTNKKEKIRYRRAFATDISILIDNGSYSWGKRVLKYLQRKPYKSKSMWNTL